MFINYFYVYLSYLRWFSYFIIGFNSVRYVSNSSQTGIANIVDTNDMLLTSIKNAKDTGDVLEMLRLHNQVMNLQQYFQALNSLFLLQKSKR